MTAEELTGTPALPDFDGLGGGSEARDDRRQASIDEDWKQPTSAASVHAYRRTIAKRSESPWTATRRQKTQWTDAIDSC
ncbi:unnamed protein product [Linum trigynum]|uniref:Uncharacterized protein n=1 Tax=Linum trigynum TaxID=586398 RepID=A0AAV2D5G4_9ROSI